MDAKVAERPTQQTLDKLRAETRDWLKKNVPPNWREEMLGASHQQFVDFQQSWFKKLTAAGLALPHWPKEWGGHGSSLEEQVVIYEELARARAPRLVLHFLSVFHAGVTLMEWGTEKQKQQYLPQIRNGQVWCQGFSEPNAGSDLAALRTRAERKGDKYIINGQKIWSTMGHFAEYCLLLARTDTTVPKHQGITYFILDLKSKGVDRRPIKQITTDEEFCECFFDNVEIPAENIIGEENKGWTVAQTTLSAERGLVVLELMERMRISLDLLVMDAIKPDADGQVRYDDDEIRREIADVYSQIETVRAMSSNFMNMQIAGKDLSGHASITKQYFALVQKRFTDLGLRMEKLRGQMFSPLLMGGGYETGNWMVDYFNMYQFNIAGGSNEIQRNIISERVLEMPREPRLP